MNEYKLTGNVQNVNIKGAGLEARPIKDTKQIIKIHRKNGNITLKFINRLVISDEELSETLQLTQRLFSHLEEQERRYRRRADIKSDHVPPHLAIPTCKGYEYSFSTYDQGGGYIVKPKDGLQIEITKDGQVRIKGQIAHRLPLGEIRRELKGEVVKDSDMTALSPFYTIALYQQEQAFNGKGEIKTRFKVHINDLARFFGDERKGLDRQQVERIIKRIQAYKGFVGVVPSGYSMASVYAVLNFEEYNAKDNTITYTAPYLVYLVKTLLELQPRRTAKGEIKTSKNGNKLLKPINSYLIKPSLNKERNIPARNNVALIVQLIEKAGNNTPHISLKTLIERNPALKNRLKKAKNTTIYNQHLKRTFAKTWELLKTKTTLEQTYKDIKLPDPKDPATIPTKSIINKMVFEFPHKGKR